MAIKIFIKIRCIGPNLVERSIEIIKVKLNDEINNAQD